MDLDFCYLKSFYIKILRKSMGKYLNGENIKPKTRNDYTDALQKLENKTGLELKNSFLRRVDFGENIPTNKPVFYYMDL